MTKTITHGDLVKQVVGKLPINVPKAIAEATAWADGLPDKALEYLADGGTSAHELVRIYKVMRHSEITAEKDPKIIAAKQRLAEAKLERFWVNFFFKHPEIAENDANKKALFERALSLSDNTSVQPAHIEEASKLLLSEGAIKARRIPTQQDLEARDRQDREIFAAAARSNNFAANEANFKLLIETLGPGLESHQIAQAIASNAVQLAPVGEEEQAQRNESVRLALIDEILDDWSNDDDMRAIKRRQLERPDVTLESLRQQVATIRERARLHQMTPAEIRAENAKHALQQSTEKPIQVASSELGQQYPSMPELIWHNGKEIPLDSGFLRVATPEQMRKLVRVYGGEQLVARLRKGQAVAVLGE